MEQLLAQDHEMPHLGQYSSYSLVSGRDVHMRNADYWSTCDNPAQPNEEGQTRKGYTQRMVVPSEPTICLCITTEGPRMG